MGRFWAILMISILVGARAAHANGIRGKHLTFVAGPRYTIDVFKNGRILMFTTPDPSCLNGRTGYEAWLGRSQKFTIKCTKPNMYSCGADGHSRCKTNSGMPGISTASYAEGILHLKIDLSFQGSHAFTFDRTIKVNGATCSGKNRASGAFVSSRTIPISSCRVRDGIAM